MTLNNSIPLPQNTQDENDPLPDFDTPRKWIDKRTPAEKRANRKSLLRLFRAGREAFPELPHTKCANDFLFHAWTQVDIGWLFVAPKDQLGQMLYARSMYQDVGAAYAAFKFERRKNRTTKGGA
jgi:hypothetical protein